MHLPEQSTLGPDDAPARILRGSGFRDLAGSSRAALLGMARVERLAKRHRLVDQWRPVATFAILGEGRVRLERANGSRLFPLGYRGPGDTVGEAAVAGVLATESASVVDECEALLLSMSAFRELFVSDASVRDALMAELVKLQRATEARLTGLLTQNVEERFAAFLLTARQRWSAPHDEGELIAATFTHADLAAMVGSTRETITLLLGKLKRDGVLGIDRRRIVVRDLAALERCAGEKSGAALVRA